MKKRLISILLALAMLFAVLPQMALLASAKDASGSCGANLTWSFDEASGTLTITGSGAMTDYDWSGNPDWLEFRSQIKSLSLPAGLTYIGTAAFIRFPITGSVVIPEGVTSIGTAAFTDCDMSAVTIPDSVKTIGYGAFDSCDNLTSVTLPAGLTEIGEEVFGSCTGLTAFTVPSGVKTIADKAFQGCTGLKSITIPDSVTAIGDNAFCRTGFETFTVGAKVASIGSKAFADCPGLTAIEVDAANPNYASEDGVLFNKSKSQLLQYPCGKAGAYAVPASVTTIAEAAFEDCTGLTALTVSGPVTAIGDYTFFGCTGLTEVTLPGSVRSIGWAAFSGCTGLTEIRIPESVTSIEWDAFYRCSALRAVKIMNKSVTIAESNTTLGDPDYTIIFGHSGSTAQTYARNNGYTFKELSQEDDPCALGHDFGEWSDTKAPTCTEDGARSRKCSRCDLVDVETIPALGHAWDEGKVTLAPTEDTPGVMTYTCTRCGDTMTKRIPKLGSTVPDDIDFTNPADADKFAIVGQQTAAIVAGEGVSLVTSQGGVEPATQNIAETPQDVIEVEIEGDWIATLKFDFNTNGASNGYYQFFGFYGATDYQNMVGIRGGDGAMQDFIRKDGAISEELNTSTPGLSANGTYWYRIEKEDTTYTCYRSSNGEDFTEMFSFADTGIDATKIVIDAYTGMTTGYKFTLKSLSFEDNGGGPVVVPVDKSALEKAIRDYEFITTTNYTPESVDAFQSAVAAGRTIRDNPDATQAEVDAAAQAILDAYAALELLPVHEHSYTAVVTAPTCTAKGYTTYTCACGDSYVGDEVDALGHDYGEWAVTKEATCTEMGEETHTCSRCGTKETRLIAALDHDYQAVVTAPTCTEAGYTTYTCSRCGDSYKGDEVAKLDHDFKDGVCTRCGAKDPDYQPPFRFDDVQDETQYYFDPVYWAVDNGITTGTTPTTFSPDSGCTRAQVVTFLWRAAGKPEPTTTTNPFEDVAADQYYYKAVLWAVEKGITTGTSATTFRPDRTCTRAQIVTFLWRSKGEPEPTTTENPFVDVPATEYYYKAVLWAVENGVTTGTSATKFSPDSTCTRAQIVTFLYRAKPKGISVIITR